MNRKSCQPLLPSLLLPFLAISAGGQALVGTSHPDQQPDGVTQAESAAPPASADHYVKPSQRLAPAPAAMPSPAAAAPAYQDSFPATASVAEPASVPPPAPRLITRESVSPAAEEDTYTPDLRRPSEIGASTAAGNHDGDIVLEVPTRPHELNRGALLHVRLREALSTRTTPEGSVFTAELLQDAGHHGEVMLPAGSLIRGRVTAVHGGKRIGGRAALHLQPETVSLPDGTLYRLDAQVTDLDSTKDVRVTDEGTVVLRSHPKATAAVLGGVTATAAVTGAVIGGGVGAAVGAVAGAGVATAWWLKRDVQETLPLGTRLIFALNQPLAVTPR